MTKQKNGDNRRPDVRKLIKQAADKTNGVLSGRILSPVLAGSPVRVRIDGLVCELVLDDASFEGWAILEAADPPRVRIVETAGPRLIQEYLQLLVPFQLVLLLERQGIWRALPANANDSRLSRYSVIPVRLTGRVSSFETIRARFDGNIFWFENIDRRRDPSVARKFRDALSAVTPPDEINIASASAQEKLAYELAFFATYPILLKDTASFDRNLTHLMKSGPGSITKTGCSSGQAASAVCGCARRWSMPEPDWTLFGDWPTVKQLCV